MAEHIPAWATTPERSGNLFLLPVPPLHLASNSASESSWSVDRKAAYLLGRNADAVDVPVNHKSASRVHACLAHGPASGELRLLDLGSVHGTFLNGERLKRGGKVAVKEGDSFQIAACPMQYRLVGRQEADEFANLSKRKLPEASPQPADASLPATEVTQKGENGVKGEDHRQPQNSAAAAAAAAAAAVASVSGADPSGGSGSGGGSPVEVELPDVRHVQRRGVSPRPGHSAGSRDPERRAEQDGRQGGESMAAAASRWQEDRSGGGGSGGEDALLREDRRNAVNDRREDRQPTGDDRRGDWREDQQPASNDRREGRQPYGNNRRDDRRGDRRGDRQWTGGDQRDDRQRGGSDRQFGKAPARGWEGGGRRPSGRQDSAPMAAERSSGARHGGARDREASPRHRDQYPVPKRRGRDDSPQQGPASRPRFSGREEAAVVGPRPALPAPSAAEQQQAAVVAVRQMMGGSAAQGGPCGLEQKKKLLWGSKKTAQPDPLKEKVVRGSKKTAQPDSPGPADAAAFGTNRWDGAQFGSDAEQAKFQRLMGVKQVPTVAPRPLEGPAPYTLQAEPAVFTKEGQSRVLSELESQFLVGVRRGNKQTTGLGVP